MARTLKEHFAIIRDREEVKKDIYSKSELLALYNTWSEEQQEYFLDYCTGVRGVKVLYDQFFKAVINPEEKPEHLEDILSLILNEKVKILKVLPNESTRIAAESSLLVLDIVVELENKSIANVEVQRIGYAFPGQRCACYSADLLMRQYKRVKSEKKKKFRYSDIKKVYTIVFFESSTAEFRKYPHVYIHHAKQKTDSGLEMDFLQEYILIPLDIFKENLHNKGVNADNRLEAWLLFLSEDEPEWILRLLEVHPEFESLYQEVYKLCQNTERMMGIFSQELAELDKNTVQYMIDEMQDTIEGQKAQIDKQEVQLNQQTIQIEQMSALIKELEKRLQENGKESI